MDIIDFYPSKGNFSLGETIILLVEIDSAVSETAWLQIEIRHLTEPFVLLEKNVQLTPGGQTIAIETPGTGHVTLRLSDSLLDLDQPVKVSVSGRTIFEGKVTRSFAAIAQSLKEREDPEAVATALLPVSW